jgi:hypothetical protein
MDLCYSYFCKDHQICTNSMFCTGRAIRALGRRGRFRPPLAQRWLRNVEKRWQKMNPVMFILERGLTNCA